MTQPTSRDPLGDALSSAFRRGLDAASTTALACPTLERLAEIGSGETPSESEQSHLADCAACTAEIALAAAFFEDASVDGTRGEEIGRIVGALDARHSGPRSEPADPPADPPAIRPTATTLPFPVEAERRNDKADTGDASRSQPWRRGLYRWATAAVLVLAAGLVTWRVSPQPPGLPDPPGVDITRGAEITLFPVSAGSQQWSELSWQAAVGVDYYVVEMQRMGGEPLWLERVVNDALEIPSEVQAGIAPGVRWRWRVRGFDAKDKEVAVSAWAERLRPMDSP